MLNLAPDDSPRYPLCAVHRDHPVHSCFGSRQLTRAPLHRAPQHISTCIHFSISCAQHREPWDCPGPCHFRFNSPTRAPCAQRPPRTIQLASTSFQQSSRAPSMQRALGPPQSTSITAQAIPPGHASTKCLKTTSYNFSQPAKVIRHMQLHMGWPYTRSFLQV